MKPPTERQMAILRWLADNDAASPATIAYGIGMDKLPKIEGSGAGWGRGSGHRVFNPAQRIISSLRGLEMRGWIRYAHRPDGRPGLAYDITDEGRAAIRWKCVFAYRGDCDGPMHRHHVIHQQKLKTLWRSARKWRSVLPEEQKAALLAVTLTALLGDDRNRVDACDRHHSHTHHAGLRLTPAMLPDGFFDFVAQFHLEAAADHQLRLMAAGT